MAFINHNLTFGLILGFLIILPSVKCQRSYLESFLGTYRIFRRSGLNDIGRTASTKHSLNMAGRLGRLQREISKEVTFPCPVDGMRSPTPPTSVHQLRPGDIDIIGALGDSLTAGNGIAASNVLHVYTENRGLSWSIGGQGTWRQFFTLPNILKEYNPNLFGYSLSDSLSIQKASQFNCAEIIAVSRDMPHMAKELIKRMSNDPRVDLEHHWKMVTILIGGNDFAFDICYQPDVRSVPANHRRDMVEALRLLRDNLPRTFVNIVLAPSFDIPLSFKGVPKDCQMYHMVEGPCFFGSHFRKYRNLFINVTKQWQDEDIQLVTLPEFNDRDDFAVVVQPFVKNLQFPIAKNRETDFTYLSSDCYHFSQKGHARASSALWNNMMEPVGGKSTDWDVEFTKFLCPTPTSPYIYTPKNSYTQQKKMILTDAFTKNHKGNKKKKITGYS